MLADVKQVENEFIIIVSYAAPFEPDHDIAAAQRVIADRFLNDEQVWVRIDDLRDAGMDWNTFVEGIFVATRNVPGSMTDPRVQGILVGEDSLVELASHSMKQEQYGATETPVFTTLEAALAHARKFLRQNNSNSTN